MVEEQYEEIPELQISLAVKEAKDDKGMSIVHISWYDTKLWVQERGLFLPSCAVWSIAYLYCIMSSYVKKNRLRTNKIEIAEGMTSNPAEWVDSLLSFPNPNTGYYASNLNPRPNQGRYPLLIEDAIIVKWRGKYVIDKGERVELPELPQTDGRLKHRIRELGLDKGSYLFIAPDFKREEGLLPIYRGGSLITDEEQNTAVAINGPSYSAESNVGFRPIRRLPEQDYISIFKEYTKLRQDQLDSQMLVKQKQQTI